MEWEMHLYVERQVGEVWVPVCPPPPATPKAKPKWGRYISSDPVEELAATIAGTEFVPTKAPRWDFGLHPVGMQQLCGFYTYLWNPNPTREELNASSVEPFLETCGLPESASRQVKEAAKACGMNESNGIWYTLKELNDHIWLHRQDPDNLPDKRVIALRDALIRVAVTAYPDLCTCKRPNCFHRDKIVRAVVWTAKIKKPRRER
jgi:hypothetical protein